MFISRIRLFSSFSQKLSSHLKKNNFSEISRNMSSTYQYDTINVIPLGDYVLHVEFNRPESRNAMNKTFWREILECFRNIKDDKDCRSVIISGAGKMFSSGIDFNDMLELSSTVLSKEDVARKAKVLYATIEQYQQSFTAIEECNKPVIAAVHGGCIGSGADLICACDIRYCTADAYFCIKEIDLGLAADVGTLQRLPKAIGNDSLLREYIYTCDKIDPASAKEIGIVSRIFTTKDDMMTTAKNVASKIAGKSPVAVQGTKRTLNYSRDHTVREGLEFMSYWNMTMLQSEDLLKAAEAAMTKSDKAPNFSKL